jgi:hypothetical protein
MTARTLPGRLSTRCLNVSGGMAAHSSYRAVARAVNDVGCWGLEQSRFSNSSHRCSLAFKSGLWTGQSISGMLLSTNHSLTDLALWQGALCWYRQLSSPNWSSTVDSMQQVKMSLYPYVFRFAHSIMRGPSPFHEKHPHTVMPPPPNFTVGTKHDGRYRSPGIHHTQIFPSDCDSSPQITRFQLSTVPWRCSLHHFMRRLASAGEMFGLWAAACPWNSIPLNSRHTVMVLAGQFIALRNSVVIVSFDVRLVSRTTFFSARRLLSVIKCGLPGHGFLVVMPSHFHFTITSPTVDLGNLRRVAMTLTDFLLMWQPITSPRSKSLSSLIYPFCWYCLVMSNTQLSASFYTGKCGHNDI